MGALKGLVRLVARGCALEDGDLPAAHGLWALPALAVLDLADNRLTTLPPSVARLGAALQVLDVSHNAVRMVPAWVGRMKTLQVLCVHGNPLHRSQRRLVQLQGHSVLHMLAHLLAAEHPLLVGGAKGAGGRAAVLGGEQQAEDDAAAQGRIGDYKSLMMSAAV